MPAEAQKERRLHEGGVGPEMRSPAGLTARIVPARPARLKPVPGVLAGDWP